MRQYFRLLFERCLEEEGVNSRLMFFVHGLVSALGVLMLTVGFMAAKDKTGYDYMVAAVASSGGMAAFGRWMTKKGSQGPAPQDSGGGDAAQETK